MATEEITIKLKLQGGKIVQSDLKGVEKSIDGVNRKAKQTNSASKSLGGLGSAASGLGSAFSTLKTIGSRAMGVISGIGNAASAIIRPIAKIGAVGAAAGTAIAGLGLKVAGETEQAEIAFSKMLGSRAAGLKMMEDVKQLAFNTPFDVKGLRESTQRMLGMGWGAQEVLPALTAAGDAAAGLNLGAEGVQRITYALSEMRTKGMVSSAELSLQLGSAGIKAWQYLADHYGTSIKNLRKLAEKGLLDGIEGSNIIIAGMHREYAGMMDEQSRTFLGRLSSMKEQFVEGMGGMMRPVMNQMARGLPLIESAISGVMGRLNAKISENMAMSSHSSISSKLFMRRAD